MLLKTDPATVNASAKTVFEFLSDSKNIEHLLPADKISEFKSDENGCSFKAQGGIVIPLIYVSKDANTKIHMKSGEKAPFSYTLSIILKETGESSCEGHMEFEANINMFMKMMVEKPLTSLFVVMTKNLQKQFD
jgi:carbon monoxide dehydrogenase subunit G